MSYPLYPQIDPKEVQQAHQFNVTHQPPTQYNHTFINPPSAATPTYQPQNFPHQPQTNIPQHNFVSSNPYAPTQSHQATQYYYYQPQQINTYPTNTQNNHQFVQQNPPQTSYPYLYQTQHTYVPQPSPPVQTGIPSQTHPVTQAPSLHSTKSIEQHQPPQEASKNVPPPQHLSDEEQEDEELETASSVITTDRKLARMLTRIERTLKRLQISIMKRNRSGTTRSKEILEASIVEIQSYHITDAEERAAVNVLIQRIQLSLKHAEEELALMEQDRQRQLAQYRNAVMEIKKEAEQAQHLLEGSLDQQTQEIIQQVHQQQHQT